MLPRSLVNILYERTSLRELKFLKNFDILKNDKYFFCFGMHFLQFKLQKETFFVS
jgi:hypothetical protein